MPLPMLSMLPAHAAPRLLLTTALLIGAAMESRAQATGNAPAEPPAKPSAEAAAAAAEPRFDILEFEIEDNSVLSPRRIEEAVMPFLGEGRTLADVEAARAALEKAYQSAGFLTVFVDVPEQRVEGGLVRLHVTEGRVERLKVTGSRYYSQGYIREKVTELAEGGVPNFDLVQRQLATVNRTEDRRVQPVLRPGKTPGTVEAELKVDDRLPFGGSVELNNRHAADTKPLRLIANVHYDNLFQRDHSLAVTAITAPEQPAQSSVLTGTYSIPTDSGANWIGYAVISDSTVQPLGATTVLGKGFTAGIRYVVPLPSPLGQAHSVSLGADYKNLRERVDDGKEPISTPLRYVPFSAAYNGSWQDESGTLTQLVTTFTFGIARLLQRRVECPGNVGPVDQFACKRQGADGGFTTLRTDLRHSRPLPFGGSVALRVGGQIANLPLASSEQYSAGGAESVRGYDEAEASGDMALLGSAEWRSPNWAAWFDNREKRSLDEVTVLGFADVARVGTLQPAAGQARRVPLFGTGVGLRIKALKTVALDIDLAWPHKATARNPDNDPSLYFRLAVQF